MLEEGLYYPFEGENWLGRFATGGSLVILSVLIVPLLALGGYFHRVLETTLDDQDEPPAFDDWEAMISDGVEIVLVSTVYALVPLLVAAAISSVLLVSEAPINDFLATAGLASAVLFILAFMVVYYLLPAALTNMVKEGEVNAAFDSGSLSDVWFSNTYFVTVLGPIALALLAHFVAFAVYVASFTLPPAARILAVLIVPFVYYYVHVAIFRMFGNAFQRETGSETVQDAPSAALS